MRKLVSVVVVALVIAACEEGPVAEPELEAPEPTVEGDWDVVKTRGLQNGEEMDTGNLPEQWMRFADGIYEWHSLSDFTTDPTSWYVTVGTYIVREESHIVIVFMQAAAKRPYDPEGRGRIFVYEYELDGPDRAEIRTTVYEVTGGIGYEGTLIYELERRPG